MSGIFKSRTFLCKLLMLSSSMVSREIWINMHSRVFQRPQIALVLRTRAILRSLKNSLEHVISKLHSEPCYYLYKQLLKCSGAFACIPIFSAVLTLLMILDRPLIPGDNVPEDLFPPTRRKKGCSI